MEKIFIEYVCLSLELVDDNFSWDSLDNINDDDEVEAFQLHLQDYIIGGFKMFINKLSIPFTKGNYELMLDLAHREIICCWNWSYNENEGKIYIDVENEINYRRLNNELKCLNILYDVLGIKGTKEEIIEEYHHLIN